MSYKHSAFISLPGGGHAFIDGIPDTCQHDYSGWAFSLGNGDILLEKNYRCPTNEETQKYIQKVADDRSTWVSGGMSVCSKCGNLFEPEMF